MEGDCDHDDECEGSLMCGTDNCHQSDWPSGADCCFSPPETPKCSMWLQGYAAAATSDCGGILQGGQGLFASPCNMNGTYSNSLNCDWVIRANGTNDRIKIVFMNFSLEYEATCNYDYVEVHNGGNFGSPSVGKYCGESVPEAFISSGHELFIKLSTDYSVAKPGFLVAYKTGPLTQLSTCKSNVFNCSDSVGCIPTYMVCDGQHDCGDGSDEESGFCETWTGKISCGSVIKESQGQLSSPNYPGNYPNDLDCTWTILSNETSDRVKITVQHFSVEYDPNCLYDYVEVYDDSRFFGKYCGQVMTTSFISSGNKLVIRLYTDAYIAKPGFLISYQTGALSQYLSCDANAFNCTDASLLCVPPFMVCDGHSECSDSSDENSAICSDYQTCSDNQFTCSYGNPKCIPMDFKCDGNQHCSDGSDEADEVCGHLNCPPDSVLSDSQGSFTSPNHPGMYPSNLNCLWRIR